MTRIQLKMNEKVEIVRVQNKAFEWQFFPKNTVWLGPFLGTRNRKDEILKKISNTLGGPGKIKTLRSSECPKMGKALYKWFLKHRETQIPATVLMISENAHSLHNAHKETPSINATSGWLPRYKKRFGIRYLKLYCHLQPFKRAFPSLHKSGNSTS